MEKDIFDTYIIYIFKNKNTHPAIRFIKLIVGCFFVGKLKKVCMLIILGLLVIPAMAMLSGCRNGPENDDLLGSNIDYTVVEDKDIPEKLKQLIDQKKDKEFRMTFTTNEYTYLTVGYGTKDTDGYSIKVRGVTLDGETIYVGTSLYGPRENEKVSSATTTPYIVLKTEKRSKTVVYK